MTRSAYAAATGSWVTITMVWPRPRVALRRKASSAAPARESRLPVGSSAKTSSGPGDQRPGDGDPLLLAAGELRRPVIEPVRQAELCTSSPSQAGSGFFPAKVSGRAMFSAAVSDGTRLNA